MAIRTAKITATTLNQVVSPVYCMFNSLVRRFDQPSLVVENHPEVHWAPKVAEGPEEPMAGMRG